MNLAVDIGNTQVKAGLFDGPTLIEQRRLSQTDGLRSWVASAAVKHVIVSSVAAHEPLVSTLGPIVETAVQLDGTTPLPFVNTYRTPSTLGTDRVAAVAGAQHYFSEQNVLAIDAGTCITYDLLDRQAYYRGGLISPGLRMRLRAMHTFTARLPLVEPDPVQLEAGLPVLNALTTTDGLWGGAATGIAAEITQMIRMYADKYSDLHVVISGGDAAYLHRWLPSSLTEQVRSVVYRPELVLAGLNSILQYYVNQHR